MMDKRTSTDDLPSHTDWNPSCTEGRTAFSKRPPQNYIPELPPFHTRQLLLSSLITAGYSTDPGQEKLLSWLARNPLHVCLSSQAATPPDSFLFDPLQLYARALSYHNRQLSLSGVSHGSTLIIWLTAGSSTCYPSTDFLLQHPRLANFCFL